MDIPAAIRAELAFRNMTLNDLSDRTGLSRQGLSKRMNGHTQFRLDEAETIAGVFGIELATLITRATPSKEKAVPA